MGINLSPLIGSSQLQSDIKSIGEKLINVNYIPDRDICLLHRWLFKSKDLFSGMKAVLLEGDPGVGKTYYGESAAKAENIEYLYYLCHAWTDDDEMLEGVNIVAAVAGDHEKVRLDGLLAKAAKMSLNKKVVILLDEIDKAEERVHNLWLDFLQTGRVQQGHEQFQGNPENIVLILTSNNTKPISDAFTRRVKRYKMFPLAVDIQAQVICDRLKLKHLKDKGKVARILAIALKIGADDGRVVSLQELGNLIQELDDGITCAKDDISYILSSWCLKSVKDKSILIPQATKIQEIMKH